nr:MAG TPA: hypothetical protein [Caudoviricetes sp.]
MRGRKPVNTIAEHSLKMFGRTTSRPSPQAARTDHPHPAGAQRIDNESEVIIETVLTA